MFTPKNIVFFLLLMAAIGFGYWLGQSKTDPALDLNIASKAEIEALDTGRVNAPASAPPIAASAPGSAPAPSASAPRELKALELAEQGSGELKPAPGVVPEESLGDTKPALQGATEDLLPTPQSIPDILQLSEEQVSRLQAVAELTLGISEYVEGVLTEGIEEPMPEDAEVITPEPSEEPVIWDENPRFTYSLVPGVGEVLVSEIQRGDTMGKILMPWLTPNETTAFLAAAKPVHALLKIKMGNSFTLIRNPETKQLVAFKYEIDKEKIISVERDGSNFKAKLESIDYKTQLVLLRGQINTHLSQAVADLNEGVTVAVGLADIFASEINFITDLREGDTFEILVEKRFRDKDFKGYGRILGAKFTNKGKLNTAYLYLNDRGRHAYYDPKGENLHRALLKAPLSFLRVTSRYSMSRRHPVYGTARPHQGIDYGAPQGTPIMAVGDGVVAKAGWAGGYGKQVIIRHSGNVESMYGHMSGFAKNIKSGKTVRQGQTIGYVGSTGVSTGPHLDFRIKLRGNFVNPDKLVVPRDVPIARNRMGGFKKLVAEVEEYFKGKDVSSYDPDTWLN